MERLSRKYKKAIRKYKKTTKTQRRCGRCLKTGHNRLTCKDEKAPEDKFTAFKKYQRKKYQKDPKFKIGLRQASKRFYEKNKKRLQEEMKIRMQKLRKEKKKGPYKRFLSDY